MAEQYRNNNNPPDGAITITEYAKFAQFVESFAAGNLHLLLVIGRPGKFSAGFDLSVMNQGPEKAVALASQGAQLGIRLVDWPAPVIFGVSGHALAMGAVLLLTADIRIGMQLIPNPTDPPRRDSGFISSSGVIADVLSSIQAEGTS